MGERVRGERGWRVRGERVESERREGESDRQTDVEKGKKDSNRNRQMYRHVI